MKLTKPIKVLIGAATVLNLASPLLGVFVWLTAVLSTALAASNTSSEPTWLVFILFFVFLPLMLLAGLTSLILIPVYLIHIIKNSMGKEIYRILSAIGLHWLPWLAMPFYFLVYIWPENPPAWSLTDSGTTSALEPKEIEPESSHFVAQEEKPTPDTSQEPEPTPEPAASEEPEEPELPGSPEATVIHWEGPDGSESEAVPVLPDLAAMPEPEAPEETAPEEIKPARKSRRKRTTATQSEPVSEETSSEEPAPSSDATVIGPSPIDKDSSDKA